MSNIKLVHSGGNSVSLTTPDSNPAANRTVKFPDANGILALTNGITEFDQWYMTSDVTSSGNNANITSWSRFTQASVSAASPLGTGMSHSSGTFSFPSTGKYLVILNADLLLVQNDNVLIDTRVTIDNSTYVPYTTARDGNSASNTMSGSGVSFAFIDVTNTSNVKVKFHADSVGSNSYINGGNEYSSVTTVLFIRIADT